ncbi:MAG: gamma-glutamyl-gamma-aminobutyrate hydrolase family protein, partial [bacterium]
YEVLLWHGARARDLPALGLCRGLQARALAHGGSLIPDLDSAGFGTAHREVPGTYTEHDVRLADGSRIAGIYGTTRMRINSSHHQAVGDPGTTVPTGWAHDGVIEACEVPEARCALGGQWHAVHADRASADLPLLRALVEAASG